MRDTIYRDEAIDAVLKNAGAVVLYNSDNTGVLDILKAIPSAEAEPTVIRSRTFMPTKDFKEWAERIREVNPNAVVIPCDAEVVSAEALQAKPTHGRLIDADALYASIAKDTYLLTDRINSRDYGMFLVGIKQKIDNAPTVQADRPQGEWVEVVKRTEQYDREGVKTWATLYQCSNCGFVLNAIEGHIGQYNFCPNCGADMRGGK